MTFRIDRHTNSIYNGSERNYKEGEKLKVQVSALLGLDTQSATLEARGKGEGFIVGRRVILPGDNPIWTNKGYAVAT